MSTFRIFFSKLVFNNNSRNKILTAITIMKTFCPGVIVRQNKKIMLCIHQKFNLILLFVCVCVVWCICVYLFEGAHMYTNIYISVFVCVCVNVKVRGQHLCTIYFIKQSLSPTQSLTNLAGLVAMELFGSSPLSVPLSFLFSTKVTDL